MSQIPFSGSFFISSFFLLYYFLLELCLIFISDESNDNFSTKRKWLLPQIVRSWFWENSTVFISITVVLTLYVHLFFVLFSFY